MITTIITTSSCEIPRVWRRLWPGVQLWTSTPGCFLHCFASRAVLRGQYLPCRNWNGAEKHRKQTRFPVPFPLEQKPLHWFHPKYFCCLSQFILSEILPIDSMVYPSTHSPTSPASASPAPPAPTAAARGRRRRPQRRDPRDCPGDPRGFNGGIGCQGRWLDWVTLPNPNLGNLGNLGLCWSCLNHETWLQHAELDLQIMLLHIWNETSPNLQLYQERKVSIRVGRWGPQFRLQQYLSMFYRFYLCIFLPK